MADQGKEVTTHVLISL